MWKLPLAVLFGTCLVFFLILQVPLVWVLSKIDPQSKIVAFERAEGTLWRGQLHNAVIGKMPIRRADFSLEPLSLLVARARVKFKTEGAPLSGVGVISWSLAGKVVVSDAAFRTDLRRLAELNPRLVLKAGRAVVEVEKLVVSAEGCHEASGVIWTNALEEATSSWNWRGPLLEGTMSCEGENVAFHLNGKVDTEDVSIKALVLPRMRYEVTARVATKSRDVSQVLPLLGFVERDGQFELVQGGELSIVRGQ